MASPDDGSSPALLSRDTDANSERLLVDLWRRMTPADKIHAAADASTATLQLALAGIRLRQPDADQGARFVALARLRLGDELVRPVHHCAASLETCERIAVNPVDVALIVASALERCGVRYVVGGSLASSVAGEPRSTIDVDMMVDITEEAIACVLDALGAEFHADADGFARAIRNRSSVNVIHLSSATKVDLFVMGALSIEPRQMDRRRLVQVGGRAGAALYVYTAEDILLQKLRWYALAHGVSDRQWRDILAIIAVQGGRLDLPYLREAAAEIQVLELLDRALHDARP